MSQGKRALHSRRSEMTYVRWESPEPQDEMYLVAAPFTEYTKPAGQIQAMVFLRTPDEALANAQEAMQLSRTSSGIKCWSVYVIWGHQKVLVDDQV